MCRISYDTIILKLLKVTLNQWCHIIIYTLIIYIYMYIIFTK